MLFTASSALAVAAVVLPPTVLSAHTPSRHHYRRADCKSTYISVDGDSCDTIAAKYGISKDDVFNANTFLNCDDIWTFTPICITVESSVSNTECKKTYYSVEHDTCDSIGGQFGMTAAEVKAANDFLTCDDIWTGTPICITTDNNSTPPPSNTGCDVTYYSRDGDTCASIGYKFGTSSDTIHGANTFLDCNDIWNGTPICIPPGINSPCKETYYSKQGDTCKTIGDAHGVNEEVIKYWNSFLDCNDIWYKRSETHAIEIRAPEPAAAPEKSLQKRFGPGRMTWYDVGLGACGWYNYPGDFIVAVNGEQFGGYAVYPPTICGSQIVIEYNGKQVQATVADECPSEYCSFGELDLSAGLFQQFASQDAGVIYANWWFGTLGDGNNNPGDNNPPSSGHGPTPVCVSH